MTEFFFFYFVRLIIMVCDTWCPERFKGADSHTRSRLPRDWFHLNLGTGGCQLHFKLDPDVTHEAEKQGKAHQCGHNGQDGEEIACVFSHHGMLLFWRYDKFSKYSSPYVSPVCALANWKSFHWVCLTVKPYLHLVVESRCCLGRHSVNEAK